MQYPFTSPTALIRNRWYIAAFANEITREPIERTILGAPVALYRTSAGVAVAMYGVCPHRYFPLARGKVEGDALVCGYHGFTFAPDGQCVNIPSQGTAAAFCQPTYRIEERGPLCWIWMGNQQGCDPALIPDYALFGLDQTGWRASSYNYFHIKGRYQLLIDNLMDLTHLPYIHSHIPGGDSMKRTRVSEEEREGVYRLIRSTETSWTPFHSLLFGADNRFEGVNEFESITDFFGPELIRTSLPVHRNASRSDGPARSLGETCILHGITPETENSTHYFGLLTRDFRLDDSGLDEFWLGADCEIRRQDVSAIEAVESRVNAASKIQRELLVRADGPALKIRRKVQSMLDADANAGVALDRATFQGAPSQDPVASRGPHPSS